MKRGFGIAETLIASMIIASLVLSFLGITNVINHAAQLSYQQSVAADLAQRRIEEMRYRVEGAWNNSRQSTETLADDEWAQLVQSDPAAQSHTLGGLTYSTLVKVDYNVDALPKLQVRHESGTYDTASNADTDPLFRRVKVEVIWSDGAIPRAYSLETVLTNWREGVL